MNLQQRRTDTFNNFSKNEVEYSDENTLCRTIKASMFEDVIEANEISIRIPINKD